MQEKNTSGLIFSQNLNGLMNARDVTQAVLAEETHVTQGAVSGWLKGSIPKGDQLLRIAHYFGVTMESLLGVKPLDRGARTEGEALARAERAEEKLKALKAAMQALLKRY